MQRPISKVSDDLLRKSIAAPGGGIQQPLVIVEDGKRWILAKGSRRLRVARALKLARVPCVVLKAPAGRDVEDYARQLRFVLTEARQDLIPSQKADLILKLRERFEMNNRQVAAYLGIAPDSVTNWLAVKNYIEPVRQAIDGGKLTMQASRVFVGLTEQGQRSIWKAHSDELMNAKGNVHRRLRKQYSTTAFPQFYRDPALIEDRLKRKSGKRKGGARQAIGTAEKKSLLKSFEFKEAELREFQRESQRLKEEITAATPIIAAILRNEKLRALVPSEMLPELERFAEIYI